MAHSFFSSLRLVHGRACGGLFHSRATDTDETSVLACSRGRENGWWLREHFSLTNSPSRRRVQSVFGQLKSVYTVTVHLTLGGQSSDTSLPNLPGPFWSFALVSGSIREGHWSIRALEGGIATWRHCYGVFEVGGRHIEHWSH